MISRLGAAYFGGAVGALISSLILWLTGQAGLLQTIGVTGPELHWDWLSTRILWGSFWALGFPLVRRRGFSPVRAGLALSLVPTLAELLIFMPMHELRILGLALGALTPLVVLATNAVWGWALARVMVSMGHA